MSSPFKNKTVLITSGPTREFLDPIRYLTNSSSGRMGRALAEEARRLGARVIVVSGPAAVRPSRGVRVIPVVTALEMRRKVLALAPRADVVIGAAAVSDWRFAAPSRSKIKRTSRPLRLTLIPNPDIIKEASLGRKPGQVFAGFALETGSWIAAARGKMRRKGLDLIVANAPSSLGTDRSRAAILTRDGRARRLPVLGKGRLARAILREMERFL